MRILVVDDDMHIVEMVKVNLELDGAVVATASNGAEGIKKAESFKPDVILMDWMMPKMDGVEAVKHIRKNPKLKKLPVFMLTAKTQMDDVDEAFKAGADNYITKPFDPISLLDIIKKKMRKVRR